ncbi:MAG: histidine phosphatase family protein [Bacteroidales bacterium]|nr:histidine phosphatase family protein [Bacteroidales bacterium]
MNLLLARHAEAADLGENGVTRDRDRPLTARGHAQAAGLATALASRGVTLDAVWSSPLLRTRQTAEPLTVLCASSPMVTCAELAPGAFDPETLFRSLEQLQADTVALVGHMPDISAYAGWLLGVDADVFPFAKGAAAWIAIPTTIRESTGRLDWFITPEWYLSQTM